MYVLHIHIQYMIWWSKKISDVFKNAAGMTQSYHFSIILLDQDSEFKIPPHPPIEPSCQTHMYIHMFSWEILNRKRQLFIPDS